MVSAVSGQSPQVALGPASANDASNKSKEAALQQKIDAKSAEQARTTCNDTAAKIGQEIAVLRSQLSRLQASDKSGSSASSYGSSPEAAARQGEFDADDAVDARNVMWV